MKENKNTKGHPTIKDFFKTYLLSLMQPLLILLALAALFLLLMFTACNRITAKGCLEKFPPPSAIVISHKVDTEKVANDNQSIIDSLLSLIKPCPVFDTSYWGFIDDSVKRSHSGVLPPVGIRLSESEYNDIVTKLNNRNKSVQGSLRKACSDSIQIIKERIVEIRPDSATHKQLNVVTDKLIEKQSKLDRHNKWLLYSIILNILLLLYVFRYAIIDLIKHLFVPLS